MAKMRHNKLATEVGCDKPYEEIKMYKPRWCCGLFRDDWRKLPIEAFLN